jgi:DNA-binding transcriptional LysR family regulator
VETRFLESLLYVVQYGSIAEAARHQGLTSAAVGQRLQALEAELGFSLVERVGHRSRPTAACLRVLPHVRELVDRARTLADRADADGLSGALRVGFIATAFQDIVPGLLRGAKQHMPGLRLNLVPGPSKELYRALIDQQIDLVVIVTPPFAVPKEVMFIPLFSEPFVLLSRIPTGATAAEVVAGMPYLRYDAGSWGGMIVERHLAQHGAQPEALCDLDSLDTIAVLVREGMGVSIVPRWHGIERFRKMIHVSPPIAPGFERPISLGLHSHRRNEPVVAAFRQLVEVTTAAP